MAKAETEDTGMYALKLLKHWRIPDSEETLPAGVEVMVPARLKGKVPLELIDGEMKKID